MAFLLVILFIIIVLIAVKLSSGFIPKKDSPASASIIANAKKALVETRRPAFESTKMPGRGEQESDGYRMVASVISSAVSNLLAPFKLAATIIGESPKAFDEIQFFVGFLRYASEVTDECCVRLATGIRQLSLVPEVRGTATASLARRIRSESFEKLDSVLNQYAQVLNMLSVEHSKSSISGSTITGAVIGKILGGQGENSNAYTVLGGLVGAVGDISNKSILQTQARLAAYVAIQQYLELLVTMPESLLDSCSALVHGGNVDLNRQSAVLASIKGSIVKKVQVCRELSSLMPQVKAPPKEAEVDLSATEWIGYIVGSVFLIIGTIAISIVVHDLTGTVRHNYDLSTLLVGIGAMLAAAGGFVIAIRITMSRIRTSKNESKPETVATQIQRLGASL